MIKFPDSQVNKIEITPDKQFIAAAGNPVIRLYEISSSSSPSPAATTAAAGGGASAGTPSNPAGASPSDPNHHLQQQQQPVLTLQGHTNNVTAVGFQKDGRYLYSCSEDCTIKVWDLRNPSYSRSFHAGGAVNSVCLRPDRDEFVSGDQNGCVKVRTPFAILGCRSDDGAKAL
jgi:G protein beta subunit-like protein